MGFLDLDADTSNLPERVPQGYFRKERPPEGFLPRLWWQAKHHPLIVISIVLLPVVIVLTLYFVVYVHEAPLKPTPVDQIKATGQDAKSTDMIQINIKENNPSTDPEYKPPRKPIMPLPVTGGHSAPSGKDE
jgi:hypothetical protein